MLCLNFYPSLREKARGLEGIRFIDEPRVGCADYPVWLVVEPSGPPAEGAVGNNIVVTAAHQHKLLVVGQFPLFRDVCRRYIEMRILFDPLDIIRED